MSWLSHLNHRMSGDHIIESKDIVKEGMVVGVRQIVRNYCLRCDRHTTRIAHVTIGTPLRVKLKGPKGEG